MKRPCKLFDRRRTFESLENRNLLAGNVTTSYAGGVLTLTGDAAANNVQISENSSFVWTVKGNAGTKIDGANSQTFSTVVTINADLAAGNDVLAVQNGSLLGELNVQYTPGVSGSKTTQISNLQVAALDVEQATAGSNVVSLNNVFLTTTGPCKVVTGDRNDVVTENKVTAFAAQITTNGGNDVVTVTNCYGADAIDVETGDGSDVATVRDSHSDAEIKIDTGENPTDGNDVINFSGLQSDSLIVEDLYGSNTVVGKNSSTTGGAIDIDMDAGNDTVILSGLHAGEALLVYVQSGKNVATVTNCTSAGELYIQGVGPASTRNVITVANSKSTAEQFSMDLSDGTDVVTVNNVSAAADSYFHGYGGANVLSVNKLHINGKYSLITLDGNDTVVLEAVSLAPGSTSGDLTIELGNGRNSAVIDRLACDNLSLDGGNQIDAVTMTNSSTRGQSMLELSNGNNVVSVNGVHSGSGFFIFTGGDNDVIAVANARGDTGFTLDAGHGNNRVSIVNCSTDGEADLATGNGTDTMTISSLNAGLITISLNGGNNDLLTIVNSTSLSDAFLDGGNGSGDTLVKTHNNLGSPTITGFERVIG